MQRYRDTGMERPKGLEGLKDGFLKKKWNRRTEEMEKKTEQKE